MAKTRFGMSQTKKLFVKPKRTSIGSSKNSRPKNKHKKKGWKKYRGQGKWKYSDIQKNLSMGFG